MISFIGKINLLFYAWVFLVFSIATIHVYAHGGVDDEHTEPGTGVEAPSVFANDEKHGTLAEGNVRLGFGLTVMAALASALGSITPFLDNLFPYIPFLAHVKITESKGFLAGSMSFASGILLALTLGDLFPEAIASFNSSKLFERKYSSLVASSIFIFTALLILTSKFIIKIFKNRNGGNNLDEEKETLDKNNLPGNDPDSTEVKIINDPNGSTDSNSDNELVTEENAKRFKSLSIQIAVALAIHNFPEGLATFATTIRSASIGTIFGIGIALHKIPEGLIISLPIYYATKSRWIAFGIAASVGIVSQMLGALLGYVLFVTVWNDGVSGVIFSIVTAGLLYAILHGMLPMAHHYDPKDKYVTNCTFAGLFFATIVSAIFSLAE